MFVDGITFDKIVLQYLSGPDAECCASLALNAISYRDDDIEIIKLLNTFHRSVTLRLNL